MRKSTRIAIAVLLAWTCGHLIVWSFASPPFQVNPEHVWSRSGNTRWVVRHVGFWPGRGSTLVVWVHPRHGDSRLIEENPGTRSLGPFNPSVYDVSEFTVYVGGAWTLLGVWFLLRGRPRSDHRENNGKEET